MLVHLGYIAAQTPDQDSAMTFTRVGDSTVVTVAHEWYRAVVVRGRVRAIRYLELEGE
jgi:hypothetical protein